MRWTRIAAVATVGVVLLAAIIIGYSPYLYSSHVASGCTGERNEGSLFISTSEAVSVEICGKAFMVEAGSGGGLTYQYHAGLVNFIAPRSVNGTTFEFWYASIGNETAVRVSNQTLSLNLPVGLSSEDSLIELFYSTNSTSQSSSAASNMTSFSTSSTSSSTSFSSTIASSASSTSLEITSTSSSTVSSTISNSSTTSAFCRGTDGTVFVTSNISTTLSIDVCGETALVPGGAGGGLDFSYGVGAVTFVAPQTADGKAFQYWYVFLPSEQEKVLSDQLAIYLPAGLGANDAIIEAFYG